MCILFEETIPPFFIFAIVYKEGYSVMKEFAPLGAYSFLKE